MQTATIHFEDHGQDFLSWKLEILSPVEAKVIDSQPFQNFVWKDCHVIFDDAVKVGDRIVFTRDFVNANEIKYPISKIERN